MRFVLVALGILLASPVSPAVAQKVDGSGVPYRAWDVDAGFGFQSIQRTDMVDTSTQALYDDWQASWARSIDVGRYWTSHLKTEVGVASLPPYYEYGTTTERVLLPGGQVGYAYATRHVRATQLVLSGTYQFMDNTFAHPYASAGVRVALIDVEWTRESYAVAPSSRKYSDVRARPFVAFGSKSYFSERTFVRPEMVMGFNNKGISQFGARLGFGIDF